MARLLTLAAAAALIAGLSSTANAHDTRYHSGYYGGWGYPGAYVDAPGTEVRAGRHAVGVRAPYAKVGVKKGKRTRVSTPWNDVDVSRRGVAVRAPFVNIFIPRY